MRRMTSLAMAGGISLATIGLSGLLVGDSSVAADHLDPPSRTDIRFDPTIDLPADIADIYAWSTATHLNMVYTFAGPNTANAAANYDPQVRYRFHLSTAGRIDDDEHTIVAQFGPGQGGNGIRVDGLPGTGRLIGPVERILTQDGIRVYAGLRHDPFFFDVLGFRETVSSGTLAIRNDRDFFAGGNDTLIAIQIPIDRVARDTNGDGRVDTRIDVWVDAFRKGGQL